jgi:hypothetical protein
LVKLVGIGVVLAGSNIWLDDIFKDKPLLILTTIDTTLNVTNQASATTAIQNITTLLFQ